MDVAVTPSIAPPAPASEPTPAPAPAPAPAGAAPPRRRASLVEDLVRDPAAFVARLEGRDLPDIVRALIAIVVLGGGVFGAVVGSYRGGRQVAFAAIKVPLLLVGALVLCAPAFIAVARAAGTMISARGVIGLTLGASARFALVLAGLAPIVWLCQGWFAYHLVILAIVAVCAAAGLAAGALLFRGLSMAPGAGRLAGLAFVAIYAVVGAHTSWMLRPFVVRPRTVEVPFVRAREGDLLDSVRRSTRSSMGIYDPDPDHPSCEGGACD